MEINELEIGKLFNFLKIKDFIELRPIRAKWYKKDQNLPPSYFVDNLNDLISSIKRLDDDWNVYIGMNGRKTKSKSDDDVEFIQNIGHDIDAHGVGETVEKAEEVAREMCKNAVKSGYQEPLIIKSGRGYWVIHHIKPILNTEENRKKIKEFGNDICKLYQRDGIQMDTSVYNPSRIMRVAGTKNVNEENNYIFSECKNNPMGIEDVKLTEQILEIQIQKKPKINLSPEKTQTSIDLFMNYCLTNKLPKGDVNRVISKNMAIYLFNHERRDEFEELYLKTQDGIPTELSNWFAQIELNGYNKYKYGIGELVNFTKKYKIPFDWKVTPEYKQWKEEEKSKKIVEKKVEEENQAKKLGKKIVTFFSKKDLIEQFLKIQPIYYDVNKIWWFWDQNEFRWNILDETDVMNEIAKNSSVNTIASKEKTEIIEALKQLSRLNKPMESKKTWVQFKDKVFDIKTGEEFNATSKYFIKNPIPFKLGENDETPMMDKIFKEWVGEKYVKTLYQIIAYSCLQDYPIHRIFCFVGAGLNGKSKFLELLRRFIGSDNCASTELDRLLNSRFEVTRLHKKLVCQMGETNFGEMDKTSLLKQLSGGDLIGFEYKNKNPFEERNYAKILIATNNLPSTTDKTVGFYRRWLIIDFPNQFTEKKDILSEIPEIEYNNLAKKSLKLLTSLMETREFFNEGDINERMEKFEDRSNPISKFIKEFCNTNNFTSFITKNSFKNKLNEWLKSNKYREMSEIVIYKWMRNNGFEDGKEYIDWFEGEKITKKQARVWFGIKLIGENPQK